MAKQRARLFLLTIVTACSLLLQCTDGFKILCAYPTVSRSHFIPAEALMIGLANKGHDVTVISSFPPKTPIPNYRHITIPFSDMHNTMVELFSREPGSTWNMIKIMPFMVEFIRVQSEIMFNSTEVQKIMADESFDAVIVEAFLGESVMGLGPHFKCPLIMFSTIKPTTRVLNILGNPLAISYVPNIIVPYKGVMDFKQRLLTFLFLMLELPSSKYYYDHFRKTYEKHFLPPKYPTFDETLRNISAIFVAHHFSQGEIRPIVPNLIEIGGVQMSEQSSPLPLDLQNWMDASNRGVIYFSLGSIMRTKDIPKHQLEDILAVFRRLKIDILWKSETDQIEGLPSNVKILSWIPQTDVLQHKNIKLFVTHGGLGSVTEGKYYGVPTVVIPIFGDQMANAEVVANQGWGTVVKFEELNEERLYHAINQTLEDPKYQMQANYEKLLYRDRPLTALENGIFWTEYIIRHRGAKHMQSNAIHLNFFQLHSLDVIGFLLLVTVIVLYINFKILKCMWQRICKRSKSKVE